MAAARETVLVTGGTGFIGRQAVRQLTAAGHAVHVVSSRRGADVPAGVETHVADLLRPGERERVVAEVAADRLMHLAWYVEPGQVWNSIENVRWLEASLGLLRDFAAAGGRRAVIAGTCSEYGQHGGVCHEDRTPVEPANLYGVSKAALHSVAAPAAAQLGVELAWTRIFFAYGPGEHPVRLVASVARRLLAGEPAPCSHGMQERDYLSTQDIGSALAAVLAADFTGVVNIGSGERRTLREIVSKVAELTSGTELLRFGAITPPPDDPPLLVADVSRLREELGWSPSLTLDEGLALTVDWWREQRDQPGGGA